MVKGKTKSLQTANGKRTRIIFQDDKIPIQIYQNTLRKTKNTQDDEKIDEVEVYPNYRIHNSEICIEEPRPNNYEYNKNGISWRLKSQSNPSLNPELAQKLSELSKFVVQVHFVQISKTAHVKSGTGILIKINEKPMILTCLHTFIPDPDLKDTKDYFLVSNSELDLHSPLRSTSIVYLNKKKKQSYLDYVKKDEFWRVDLDRNFLQFRKNWLLKIKSEGLYEKIKEPKSQMKPSPAFDISFLNIPEETFKTLITEGSQFFDLKGKNVISFQNNIIL